MEKASFENVPSYCIMRGKRGQTIATKSKKPVKLVKTDARHTRHDFILKTLALEKVTDIISIDLKGKTAIADYMVIATGTSSRQVVGAAQKLRDKLSAEGVKARVEGMETGDWVIVDAHDVIVHLFRPETRSYYNLEKLWGTDFSTMGYNLYTSGRKSAENKSKDS